MISENIIIQGVKNIILKYGNEEIVGYRNVDYERKTCELPNSGGKEKEKYYYYNHQGASAYECVVALNDNIYSSDELFSGEGTNGKEDPNVKIRKAYITALARERGNSYKTYGFLNNELETRNTMARGEVTYTVHFFYQNYDYNSNSVVNTYYESGTPFISTDLVETPITNLTLNRTPNTGYRYLGDKEIKIYDLAKDGWVTLDNSNNRLKSNTIMDIGLYFNVDTNVKKTLFYNVEYYLWNENTAKYDFIESKRTQREKWINAENNLDVNIERTYRGATLIYTDPNNYAENNQKAPTETVIKAYYSRNPKFTDKSYTVRYHSNSGKGNMDDDVFKFYQNSTLKSNSFTKKGYVFDGWSLQNNGEIKYQDVESIVHVNDTYLKEEDGKYYLDLYAHWTRASYQIKYLPNNATSGNMQNSSHNYDERSKLSKNQYKREFNVTLNLGPGQTNFYKEGSFGAWGSNIQYTYDNNSKEYKLVIPANSNRYSGLYYTEKDAIIKPGKTATISYEVYSNRQVTLAMKYQNSVVGNADSKQGQAGSKNVEPDLITIPAKTWTTVYFAYTNNSKNSIYDYSILAVEDNDLEAELTIRNPKFEIINANTVKTNNTETTTVSSEFLGWTDENGVSYKDEQEIFNLTDEDGKIINMTPRWKDYMLYLPEMYVTGYTFEGWVDSKGNKYDPEKPIEVNNDLELEAIWKDTEPPNVEIKVTNTTTSSIQVNTVAEDKGSGMANIIHYIYYIKEKGKPESEYKQFDGGTRAEYTFNNLKQNTTYDIRVEVMSDKANNNGVGETLGTTRRLTGNINVKEQLWYKNEKDEGSQYIAFEKTNVSSDNIYIQYRLDNSSDWIKGESLYGVKLGQTVYAELSDGINTFGTISVLVADKIKPTIEIFDKTAVEAKNNSLLVDVYASDEETGLGSTPLYTYSYKKHTDQNYTTEKATSDKSFNFTNLESNTLYDIKVNVSDLAGNIGEAVTQIKTAFTYKIHFDGNGETSGTMQTMTCIENKAYKLTKNTFEKKDSVFYGWTFENEKYKDEQYIMNLSKNGEDVTLVADWTDDTKPKIEEVTPFATSIKIVATDDESGVVGYAITENPNQPDKFTQCEKTDKLEITITELERNTKYYVWVKDAVGNISDYKQVTTL